MSSFQVGAPIRFLHLFFISLILSCLAGAFSPASAQSSGTAVRLVWSHLEAPDFSWPYPLPLSINAMTVDRSGNTFTMGLVCDSIDCCDGPYLRTGHLFVDKYDHTGHKRWRRDDILISAELVIGDIGTDRDGNVYVVEGDAGRGKVVSYNPNGVLRWSYDAGDEGLLGGRPAALAIGNDGHVYIAGWDWFHGDRLLMFDTSGGGPVGFSTDEWNTTWGTRSRIFVTQSGAIHTFGMRAAVYSPDGLKISSLIPSAPSYDVAEDSRGNSYLLQPNGIEMELYRLDSVFGIQWHTSAPVSRVLVDSSGNAIIIGDALLSSRTRFAAKVAPDGQVVWHMQWAEEDFNVYACEVDLLDNLYVLGLVESGSNTYGVLQSFDPDGVHRWSAGVALDETQFVHRFELNRLPGEGAPILCADSRGDIHLAGTVYYSDSDTSRYSLVAQYTQAKTMIIQDAHRNPIPNETFTLIRVHDDPPQYTEDTLGQFATNSRGQFEFPLTGPTGAVQYLFPHSALNPTEDVLYVGDTLKVARLIQSRPGVRHPDVLATEYSVILDNGDFLDNGRPVFDTVELGSIQRVTLDHSEYRYNLLVSVEWDAEQGYLAGLQNEFRQASNYLYDVSDGQIRFDTVMIVDSKQYWNRADVTIRASNLYGPVSNVKGVEHPGWMPINMPRKWFYKITTCRDSSLLMHPLDGTFPNNYRTIVHEFGHYALGFGDEYMDLNYNQLPDNGAPRCLSLPAGNYGFMDAQYLVPNYGPYASEMSNQYRYQNVGCQNTDQWGTCGLSCWDYLESQNEGTSAGIYLPIRKPHKGDSLERVTPAGLDYFPGPNDDLNDLDYDVGRLVDFPFAPLPPAMENHSMLVSVSGTPVGGAGVSVIKRDDAFNKVAVVRQGRTTNLGLIWALGVNQFRDEIEASGLAFTAVGKISAALQPEGVTRHWRCAQAQLSSGTSRTATTASLSPDGDSVNMTLREIRGDYPMVCGGTLNASGWEYGICFSQALNYVPQLEIVSEGGDMTGAIFSAGIDSYGSQLGADQTTTGDATVWCVDNTDTAFFFNTPYVVAEIASNRQLTRLAAPDGDATIRLDSSNSGIQKVMLLASDYPPIMTGLDVGAIQGGRTHSVSVFPEVALAGVNSIAITYSDADLRDAAGTLAGNEAALRIYRWDRSAFQWRLVGGAVDTVHNVVYSSIDQTGIYGAFTLYGGGNCCTGKRGNINLNGIIDASDLSTFVSYLTNAGYLLPCPEAANVNGAGIVDAADLSALVSYLTNGGYVLPSCP